MRRKHKIKDVKIYDHAGRIVIRILTNAGSCTIPISQARPALTYIKLKWHLPHLYDELSAESGWSEEELADFLRGRYLYGNVTEIEYDGNVVRIIS